MAKWYIGIDLGGTFTKTCLMDDAGRSKDIIQRPTPTEKGGPAVVEAMGAGGLEILATHGLSSRDVAGVGIGSPGPLDMAKGVVLSAPNIPGLGGLPMRDRVGQIIGAPAVLENDANAAGFGEYVAGTGAGLASLVLLTIGTGIGSGIILDGQILHGANGVGGEAGHILVEAGGELCGCGQHGCLERYCSATYLALWAKTQIEQRRWKGPLADVLAAKGELDARDVNEARKAGDTLAAEAWHRAIRYLAMGCITICRLLDPNVIALAGGMTKAGDDLMVPLREEFLKMHWTFAAPRTQLTIAKLGGDAGAIGAAALARHLLG
ncbi:MAG: ROK family protein [Planctomycetota bacterium]|nr:ROK family protein [Planctomycetota bacterium]